MTRLKCTLAYDGTNFSGYQVQPGRRTVQGEVEAVLASIHKGEKIKITASGRTDAGVHALGQVFHFDTHLRIPLQNWVKAINRLLPDDLYIFNVEEARTDFHARFDVKKKEYRYRLLTREIPDLFRRHYTFHFPDPLCLSSMEEAAGYLKGTHDFTSFCAAGTSVADKVRTLYDLAICQEKEDETVIRVVGSGFLYQMVRIIVGTLLDVGTGKLQPADVLKVMEARDRAAASRTAPGQGLTMWKVYY